MKGHHFRKSQAEATAASLKTGMDNECADFFTVAKDSHDYQPYLDAVKQGFLTEADIDVALKRLFTARMRLGMFDPPEKVPYAQTPESEIDSAAASRTRTENGARIHGAVEERWRASPRGRA